MALIGSFDPLLRKDAWFDDQLIAVDWFDASLVDVASSGGSTYSAFSPATVPVSSLQSGSPATGLELGVSFKVDVAGTVTAIRFYKDAGFTGTHIGSLWDSSGTSLGTVTFTGETSSGWQQANFSSPISIAANTVYVASFFSPDSHYLGDNYYFQTAGVDNGPLHLIQDGVGGVINGRYGYNTSSVFPTNTWNSFNVWVDVVFSTASGGSTSVAGAAAAIATATGAPAISDFIAGSASAVSAATGSVAQQVFVAASALAVSSLSGSVAINQTISAAAQSVAAASGAIAVTTFLTGLAQAVATATGNMTVIDYVAGQAQSVAAATGAISQSSVIYAASCSVADINTAMSAASAGDVVQLPNSPATWTTTLTITKAITLRGGGGSNTVITNGGANPLISIAPTSDLKIRVTGIYFDQVTNTGSDKYSIIVGGVTNNGYALTQIRIDNNTFNKGKRTIYWYGWAYGVVDHNQFINCDIAIAPQGDSNNSWARVIQAGTSNAVFIEDNTFTVNSSVDYEPNEQIYHQDGARSVVRYNTFDSSTYTSGQTYFYESHGNINPYTGTGSDQRGQPLLEVYNNSFTAYQSPRMLYFRGGSVIAHDNAMAVLAGSTTAIVLTEEEGWTSGGTFTPKPYSTTWPAEDQINNSFFWNNTLNGSAVTTVGFNSPSTDPTFIQLGRDYFMTAPQATGGSESYTGRAGGPMTYTSSGANAYYSYTAYTYPHPLVTATTTLSATAQAVAAGSGVIGVTDYIAGQSASVASGTGNIAVTDFITASAQAIANVSGGVSVAVLTSGLAQAIASASGNLSVSGQTSISGGAGAVSSASGTVAIQDFIAGTAQAVAATGGTLAVIDYLSGLAASTATATGSVSVINNTALSGQAAAVAAATGGLNITDYISALAQGLSSATAAPTVTSFINASAAAIATLLGTLSDQVILTIDQNYVVTIMPRQLKATLASRKRLSTSLRKWKA